MRRLLPSSFFIVVVVAVIAIASCGRSNGINSPTDKVDSIVNTSGEFFVETFDENNPDQSQVGRLTAQLVGKSADGNTLVEILATDAANFKSALLHLHYDTAIYTPVKVTKGDFLDDPLFLAVTHIPGIVAVGSVVPDPLNKEGAEGTGVVASVEFRNEPIVRERRTSVVPNNTENKITFASVLDDPPNKEVTIIFTEKNLGNYDLNTEVSVADITPIALRYLQAVESGNPANDPVAVVDGDFSGDVGISDITPIATNYLNEVEAYGIRWGIESAAPSAITDKGLLPNYEDIGAPFSCSRHYSGDGLAPRYAYTFDYGAQGDYTGDDGTGLRFYIRPYGQGAFGIEGGPFSTAGGPGGDIDPPTWQSWFGIVSAQYTETNDAINISFGKAIDDVSPPVVYVAYWQTGDTLDYADALANNRYVVLDTTGQTDPPFTATLTAADGLTLGGNVSIGVHARDSASPFNETTALNPHPFNPNGLDWIIAVPGTPPGDDPPVWGATIGITEADPGNTSVTVGWGTAFHIEGAPSFEVYWKEGDYTADGAGFFASANHVNVDTGYQTDITELTNDTLYSFGVRAKSPRGTFDTNTKVLTATPMESVFPFVLPPADNDYDIGVVASDSDIVLTPIDNAPAIVYTRGSSRFLGVCYYNGTQWAHETVATNGYLEHPSIEIVGDAIVVSAFNRYTKALEVYTGDTLAQNWVLTRVDDVSTGTNPIQFCYTACMEYEPISDTLGIVYNAGVTSTKSILKYAFKTGDGAWTTEIIKESANGYDDAPGASFVFTPNGDPSVAFTFGDFDPDPSAPIYDTYVYYGVREGGVWNSAKLPGNWQANQPIFLTYNTVTDQPFIIFGRDRFIEVYPGINQPVTDTVIAWKDAGGLWTDQVLEEGYAYFNTGDFSLQAELAGADPVIGFNAAGFGFLYYSFISVQTGEMLEGLTIKSYLTESTFNDLDWEDPTRFDLIGTDGCSAINMAIDVSEPRLTYSRIGVLTDAPAWNEFPSGDLIYHQL